jgi:hypothetical protein
MTCFSTTLSRLNERAHFLFVHAQAGNLTSWLSLFNFNVFLSGGGTCIAPLTDFELLVTGLWVPLLCFGFLMANMLLHYMLWLCTHKQPQCVDNRVWELEFFQELKKVPEFGRIVLTYRRTTLGFFASSCMCSLSPGLFATFTYDCDGGRSVDLPNGVSVLLVRAVQWQLIHAGVYLLPLRHPSPTTHDTPICWLVGCRHIRVSTARQIHNTCAMSHSLSC